MVSHMHRFLEGEYHSDGVPHSCHAVIDVRDVVTAHISALQVWGLLVALLICLGFKCTVPLQLCLSGVCSPKPPSLPVEYLHLLATTNHGTQRMGGAAMPLFNERYVFKTLIIWGQT